MQGKKIRQKLAQMGMPQKELARLLDVSPQAVASILCAKDVRTSTVERICQALDLPITFFYEEGGEKPEDHQVKTETEMERELEYLRGQVKAYETALRLLAGERGGDEWEQGENGPTHVGSSDG